MQMFKSDGRNTRLIELIPTPAQIAHGFLGGVVFLDDLWYWYRFVNPAMGVTRTKGAALLECSNTGVCEL